MIPKIPGQFFAENYKIRSPWDCRKFEEWTNSRIIPDRRVFNYNNLM